MLQLENLQHSPRQQVAGPVLKVWDREWKIDADSLERVAALMSRSHPPIRSVAALVEHIEGLSGLEQWAQNFGLLRAACDGQGKPYHEPIQLSAELKPARFKLHLGTGLFHIAKILNVAGARAGCVPDLTPEQEAEARYWFEASKDCDGYPKIYSSGSPLEFMRDPAKKLEEAAAAWRDFGRYALERGHTGDAAYVYFSPTYRLLYAAQKGFPPPSATDLMFGKALITDPALPARFCADLAAALRNEKCFIEISALH